MSAGISDRRLSAGIRSPVQRIVRRHITASSQADAHERMPTFRSWRQSCSWYARHAIPEAAYRQAKPDNRHGLRK